MSGSNSPEACSPKRFLRASLDNAALPEGVVWRFDVDHILRCLALALQDLIILSVRESRPHGSSASVLQQTCIYLEPKAYQKLQGGAQGLNDIAVRRIPTTWAMYTFLRSAMVGWHLSPEVAVVTLVYIERLAEVCSLRLTPDNWQRLSMTCMMLASKVWDDESYENRDFAKACPLYTVDDINTMERTFLKLTDYRVLVTGSQYAKCYFKLRVTGARDQAEMMKQQRAAAAASQRQGEAQGPAPAPAPARPAQERPAPRPLAPEPAPQPLQAALQALPAALPALQGLPARRCSSRWLRSRRSV